MSSYGKYLIFPEYIIEGVSNGGVSNIVVVDLDGDEKRLKKGGRRRRFVEITGCRLIKEQHEVFQTFCDLVEDAYESFLFRIIGRCKAENEPVGIGNGANKVFQLSRTRSEQGRSKTTAVHFPDHDYPERFWPAPEGKIPNRYWPCEGHDGLVHVFVDGVAAALDTSTQQKLDDLRYKGLATLQNAPYPGAVVTWSGYFYHLMRFADGTPTLTPLGGGTWEFDSAQIIEPKGGR